MSPTQSPRVELAMVWHMHQPDYRDRQAKRFQLPWVRLHALKDYYDMPARLERFGNVRQTFNLVPSLMVQMENYLEEGWSEIELELYARPANQLSEREKVSMLEMFFNAPEETMISPHPRYASLLRESRLRSSTNLVQFWSEHEWRDLQVWRQLSWFDPMIREQDRVVDDFIRQGQNFSEDQKQTLTERIRHWIGESLAIYRRLQDAGVIEVSVTPFYHPILPLLIDPASAQEAMPSCPMPDPHGLHPEDARAHMEKAMRFYEDRFGRPVRGVWPSEGSVSQATAELFAELGIEWFASDEEILFRSLALGDRGRGSGEKRTTRDLYRSYRAGGAEGPSMVFRDHRLSDLIGFEYQHWDPAKATEHFIHEVLALGDGIEDGKPPLVTVILDGENCWEYYRGDGNEFLDALYKGLSENPDIACVTVSEGLEGRTPRPLERLSAGSWINGNFYIWMGEDADRKAWAMVERARRALVEAEKSGVISADLLAEAWEEVFIAEGSDWFWWFGETHSTNQMTQFDEMFRKHLLRVYELVGIDAPRELLSPLQTTAGHAVAFPEPLMLSAPLVDGKVSHYYEWRAAVHFEPDRQGGAMVTAEGSSIRNLFYGCDPERMFLRADPAKPLRKPNSKPRWELKLASPKRLRIRFIPTPSGYEIERLVEPEQGEGTWERLSPEEGVAAEEKVFEAAISWKALETNGEETVSFFVGFSAGKEQRMEMIPALSCLGMTVPGKVKAGQRWFP